MQLKCNKALPWVGHFSVLTGRMSKEKPTIKDNGYEIHAGYRIRLLQTKAGKRYQVDLGRSTGKHIRLSFPSLQKARNCAFTKSNAAKNQGVQVLAFSNKQRTDATVALKALEPFGISLKQAADFYSKHNQVIDHTNGTSQLLDRYLAYQKQRVDDHEIRVRSYSECQKHLRTFKESMGHLAINTITGSDVDRWLDEQKFKATSRNNHRRYLSGFFNWCLTRELLMANPVLRTRKIKMPSHTPDIYSAEEVKTIMLACVDFISSITISKTGKKLMPRKVKVGETTVVPKKDTLIPYMALAFFTGIRPNEIMRLRWRDIDLCLGEIHVNATASKTSMARIVHMPDNLKSWLIPYKSRANSMVFPYSETLMRSWRRAIFEKLDIKHIQDGARHSFATYYLALNTMDDTIQELGHADTKMLFKHYRGLAKNRKTQANKYFSILPLKKNQIIALSKAV